MEAEGFIGSRVLIGVFVNELTTTGWKVRTRQYCVNVLLFSDIVFILSIRLLRLLFT